MFRIVVVALIFLVFHETHAQTWQELNRESVELFEDGKTLKAAKLAQKAANLYQKSENYTPVNHSQLQLLALEFYETLKFYRRAGFQLENTIHFIEKRYPEGHETIIKLWKVRSEMRFLHGDIFKTKFDKGKVIGAAERLYGKAHYKVAQEWLTYAGWSRKYTNLTLAIRFIKNAKKIMDENYKGDHPLKFMVDLESAKINLFQNQLEEAEVKYLDLIGRMEVTDQDVLKIIVPAYGQLARVYQKQDRPQDIGVIINKVVQILPYVGGEPFQILRMSPKVSGSGYVDGKDSFVNFRFSITAEGQPYNIEVAEEWGPKTFIHDARKALERSRFIPKLMGGKATGVDNVTYSYRLRFSDPTPERTRLAIVN